MGDLALQADKLSKRYRMGERQTYRMLRDSIAQALRAPLRRAAARASADDWLWALRDVSFTVRHGEVVGIIGRNGAGKSTLLKILSRITTPTSGNARIHGRVGSLLEVGTGFHPELTGRENIYLNGAILGMTRADIRRNFDAIVAFAEIEKFIDTPVKRYSSGMYVRLAFAVAAHLEPEILIVDEVLAVGDTAFQKKCLGKMGEVAHQGRTVLFVSHNMDAVASLCTTALLIEQGHVVARDTPQRVIARYLEKNAPLPTRSVELHRHPGRQPGTQPMMQAIHLRFENAHGAEVDTLEIGGNLVLTVDYHTSQPSATPVLGFRIQNSLGTYVLGLNNKYFSAFPSHSPATHGYISCKLSALTLVEGRYTIDLWFGNPYEDHDIIEHAISFDVKLSADTYGVAFAPAAENGVIVWPAQWQFEAAS